MKLTVFYDGQFWVGVLEEERDGTLRAARFVFGPEPKDQEVLDAVVSGRIGLGLLSRASVDAGRLEPARDRRLNPKRMLREAAKESRGSGVSTYAHDALQAELALRKKERRVVGREEREREKERRRELAREKAKAKHRGR